ncbi:MAG: hypothetical protein QOE61_1098, partial [Micromonosporaceae bacterium]|nr:hypothetical protein [Micromonosporaceae bacterium]
HLVRRFGYLRKRPEILELRFRYAATLGYAERIAERWTTRRRGARSKAKEKMTERLKTVLEERDWRAVVGFPLPHELARQCDQHESNDQELEEEKARKWIWTVLSSDNEPAIRVVLQLAACQEMYRLHTDRIIASLLSFRLPGRGRKTRLTRRTVRLFRYIWAPLRLKAAWTHWEEKGFFRPCPDGQTPKWPLEKASPGLGKWWRDRALHRTAKAAHWPMPAAQLAKTVGPQLQRRRGDRIAFMDLYNAACIYGYALSRYVDGPGRWSGTADGSSTANARGNGREQSPQDLSEEEKTAAKALIEKSMEYLREAMAHADSDVATRKRVWILANDPDLIPLRYQPAFGRFEVDVYPTMVTGFPRPRRIIGVRAVECTRRLIQRGADALAETWHDRALGRGDAEQAIRWLKNEIQTWRTLQSIADTDGRHWLYRKEFIEIVRGVVDSDALNHREFPPSLPLFEDVVNEYCMDGYDEMVNTEYVQSLEETRALNCLTKEQTQNVERGIQDMAKRCENNIAEAERLTEALSTSRPWRNLLRRTSVEWICQERRKQWHAISADMAGSLRLPRS